MTQKKTVVHFLIAGAQKCGTSALDAYLRNHPEIAMAREKEVHYFDRETGIDWRQPDTAALDLSFDRLALRGEATPVTLYWTPSHYRILRYNPDMRFILILRDPTERAFSHWRMNRANNLETLSFSNAVRDGRMRVLDGEGPMGLHRFFSYVERGFYARQIQQLSGLFPMESILILRQTDLEEAPDLVLSNVARFLGLGPMPEVKSTLRVNSARPDGHSIRDEDRAYLDEIFAPDLALLRSLTGIDVRGARAK